MGGHRVLAFFFIFGGMDTTETTSPQVVEQLATCTIEQPVPGVPWEQNQRMQLTAHTVGTYTTYTLSTEGWAFENRDGIYRLADKLAELAQAITP